MVCFVVVQIEVRDEAAARDALKALGLTADVFKTTAGFSVRVAPYQEAAFRTQYAKTFTLAKAKANYYRLAQETEDAETVTLRLTR